MVVLRIFSENTLLKTYCYLGFHKCRKNNPAASTVFSHFLGDYKSLFQRSSASRMTFVASARWSADRRARSS